MPGSPFNELLRNVSAASIALETQREALRTAMINASQAGESLRKIAAASAFSHEGVRKMIGTQNREAMEAFSKRMTESLKPMIEQMQANGGALQKMVAEASRQASEINAQMSRQFGEQLARIAKNARPRIE